MKNPRTLNLISCFTFGVLLALGAQIHAATGVREAWHERGTHLAAAQLTHSWELRK